MPITQSRMIEIIVAAQDFKEAAERIQSSVIAFAASAARGEMTYEEAFFELETRARLDVLCRPDSAVMLAIEAHHFKKNQQLNERAKERQARFRANNPGQFHRQTTAPRTLTPVAHRLTQPEQIVTMPGDKSFAQQDLEDMQQEEALIASGVFEIDSVLAVKIPAIIPEDQRPDEAQLRRVAELLAGDAVQQAKANPPAVTDSALVKAKGASTE